MTYFLFSLLFKKKSIFGKEHQNTYKDILVTLWRRDVSGEINKSNPTAKSFLYMRYIFSVPSPLELRGNWSQVNGLTNGWCRLFKKLLFNQGKLTLYQDNWSSVRWEEAYSNRLCCANVNAQSSVNHEDFKVQPLPQQHKAALSGGSGRCKPGWTFNHGSLEKVLMVSK